MTADHQHAFATGDDGIDRCSVCDVSWRDAVRGFGSNVAPTKRRGPALQRPSTNQGLSKSEAVARNGRVTSGG